MRDTRPGRATGCAVAGDLHWWTARAWSGGLELEALVGLECFSVRTRNSTYEITVLSPHTGAILVRGGPFFPVRTSAQLSGCSLGGGLLKLRAIYPGFMMEIVHGGRTIVTTAVRSIDGPASGSDAVN
jgi:hypothetical protein